MGNPEDINEENPAVDSAVDEIQGDGDEDDTSGNGEELEQTEDISPQGIIISAPMIKKRGRPPNTSKALKKPLTEQEAKMQSLLNGMQARLKDFADYKIQL